MKLDINNIRSLLYFFAPFLIVCYFLLFSLINMDLKGIIYLIGLFISLIVTIFIGNGITKKDNMFSNQSELCNFVTINHIANISNVPLSISVYCFTTFYLLYTMAINNSIIPNILLLVFLGILILTDMIWLTQNNCFSGMNIMIGMLISGLMGILWGYLINKFNNKDLQYFTADDNICTIPKRKYFKCNTKQKE